MCVLSLFSFISYIPSFPFVVVVVKAFKIFCYEKSTVADAKSYSMPISMPARNQYVSILPIGMISALGLNNAQCSIRDSWPLY